MSWQFLDLRRLATEMEEIRLTWRAMKYADDEKNVDQQKVFEQKNVDEQKERSKRQWEATERNYTMIFDEMVELGYIDPNAVQVIEQSILAPQIGRAVIAMRDFEPGDVVCSYGGNILDKAAVDEYDRLFDENDPRGCYIVNTDGDQWYVDGFPQLESAQGHMGNFINDARGIAGAQYNCSFDAVYNEERLCYILIQADRSIAAGEELWLDYGSECYWKN